MKQKFLSLATVLVLAVSLLAGCGASASGGTASMAAEAPAAGISVSQAEMGYDAVSRDEATSNTGVTSSASGGAPEAPDQEAKRIYTANLELESTDFEGAAKGLAQVVESAGGYFESSSIGSYGDGYRHGEYVARIPAEQFDRVLSQMGELCHVTWQSSNCQDVSEYYYDTQGRLKTQQTKLERLQTLLARAENMEDIITLESAISDTEQTIESLSGELQHYDALVDYSTITFSLNEVYRLSNTEEPADNFASRLGSAFASGWSGLVSGLQDILLALAYGWGWIVLLALLVAVGIGLARASRRRREARNAAKSAAAEAAAQKIDDKMNHL